MAACHCCIHIGNIEEKEDLSKTKNRCVVLFFSVVLTLVVFDQTAKEEKQIYESKLRR